jgi:hypothetical protein
MARNMLFRFVVYMTYECCEVLFVKSNYEVFRCISELCVCVYMYVCVRARVRVHVQL